MKIYIAVYFSHRMCKIGIQKREEKIPCDQDVAKLIVVHRAQTRNELISIEEDDEHHAIGIIDHAFQQCSDESNMLCEPSIDLLPS